MRDGISGAACPDALPFASVINQACIDYDFFPPLVGAIKYNETGLSTDPAEMEAGADRTTGLLRDGSHAGHGIMQLTSSWPSTWADPASNVRYAITYYLRPSYEYWRTIVQGDDLVRAVAASYNAGFGAAMSSHNQYGDVDYYTTCRYGERALFAYHALRQGRLP